MWHTVDRLSWLVAFLAGAAWAKGTSAEWRRWVRFTFRRALKGIPLTGELWEGRIRSDVRAKRWAR